MAADQGNAEAQYNLGVLYNLGQGVPQNHAEAARWYRMAADQGNARAQNNLGADVRSAARACLRTTPRRRAGIAEPPSRAMRTRKPASARLYDRGKGVSQNYAEAVRWFRRAADQGMS